MTPLRPREVQGLVSNTGKIVSYLDYELRRGAKSDTSEFKVAILTGDQASYSEHEFNQVVEEYLRVGWSAVEFEKATTQRGKIPVTTFKFYY